MATAAEPHDAIVLRTLRYGEADLIAHLFSRQLGRVNAMAKGARRPKSRLGARLDPFLVTSVMLRSPRRGDLAHVQGVAITSAHDRLRTRYRCQQVAASALDTLGRLTVEHNANEPAYNLACRMLDILDAPTEPDDHHLLALAAAYELKLLHVTGLAPHLSGCTRCGGADQLRWFSIEDGGVVCDDCASALDRPVGATVLEAAVWAIRTALTDIAAAPGADLPTRPDLRTARNELVGGMCRQHAGFTPKT